MSSLRITLGQHSDRGRKPVNQDFHGALLPPEPLLSAKGAAFALADGISSSSVSQIAAAAAVRSFLDDYYCTSAAWSVKTAVQRVLAATNSWLHAQTQQSPYRYDADRGYVCAFAALVIKSATAHIFHSGDVRVYRCAVYVDGEDGTLEPLTRDHRVHLSADEHYLGAALGFKSQLEADYVAQAVEPGDLFVLASDGVYEHIDAADIARALATHGDDFDAAAKTLIDTALQNGSDDNLTIQLVRIDAIGARGAGEMVQHLAHLPFPPALSPRVTFDGYDIVRELHSSHRSHLFLARDRDTQQLVALKIPSTDLRDDAAYLENFLMEEWVARRIDNAHVARAIEPTRPRRFLYTVFEYIDGQTLAQWMTDHPAPNLAAVRTLVDQVARGLRAFHRAEMLHQDLRPENILIDATGTARIIDFGSASIAGVLELEGGAPQIAVRGAVQYAAPEYFLGETGTPRSDIFSLGVITYQMLTGRLPYGADVARSRTRAAQNKLVYQSARLQDRGIPAWIDDVLRKAVHPNPANRYEALSEFTYDLRHPRPEFLARHRLPLIERNPVLFWKCLSLVLMLVILILFGTRA